MWKSLDLFSGSFLEEKNQIVKAEQHDGRLQGQMISSIHPVRAPECLMAVNASIMSCEEEAQVEGGSALRHQYHSSSLPRPSLSPPAPRSRFLLLWKNKTNCD